MSTHPDHRPDAYPGPFTSLHRIRGYLAARLLAGTTCPACDQTVKMYRRPLHSSMAAALLELYRAYGLNPGPAGEVWTRTMSADASKLRHWGLTEPGPAVGEWSVTPLGRDWLAGLLRLPPAALLYNGRCYGLDLLAAPVTFAQVLGRPFNRPELDAVTAAHLVGPVRPSGALTDLLDTYETRRPL